MKLPLVIQVNLLDVIHDVLVNEILYCHLACNLQKMKSLIKNLPNLKSINFPNFTGILSI